MFSPLRGYSMFANPLMSPHQFFPTSAALKHDFPILPSIENSPTTGVPKHELPVPPKIEDSPTTMCRRNSTPTHGGRRLPPPTFRRVAALPTFRRGASPPTSGRRVALPTHCRGCLLRRSVEMHLRRDVGWNILVHRRWRRRSKRQPCGRSTTVIPGLASRNLDEVRYHRSDSRDGVVLRPQGRASKHFMSFVQPFLMLGRVLILAHSVLVRMTFSCHLPECSIDLLLGRRLSDLKLCVIVPMRPFLCCNCCRTCRRFRF